jgi:hypothetical protein
VPVADQPREQICEAIEWIYPQITVNTRVVLVCDRSGTVIGRLEDV